jgi:predicted enzyme related to lactoylglutathione lyase
LSDDDDHIGELRFLYVGAGDVDRAVAFYQRALDGRLRWRFQHFGADVAGIELDSGPMVLLTDHRPIGTVLPIWTVDDLASRLASATAAGASVRGPMGTPEGDVIVVEAPGGHELAFLDVVRPGALDQAYADESNSHRVIQ